VACIAIVRTDWGLAGVIVAAAGTMVCVRIVNTIFLFVWEKPWLFPRFKYFDSALIYGMLKQGIGLFIIASSSTAIFQIDKLIIAHFRGPYEVATYSVIGRPFMLVFSVYIMILGPLWPAHGEALRRGDIDWVRRALRLSIFGGCVAIVMCGLAMFFFGDQILRIWTRGAMMSVPRSLVVAMTALFLMWIVMGSISILLNSAGILRVQTWFVTAHAALNLIIAIAVAPRYGATGVAWSIPIAGLFTSAWGYPWMLRRYVLDRRWEPTPQAVVATDAPA
jgi:O-antigen/teichoic acid export membrane protein